MAKSAAKKKPVIKYPHGITFTDPHKTEQHHRDQVDTSVLTRRWMQTGIPPTHQRQGGWYGVVPALDYQTAQNTVIKAEQSFFELPAEIRSEFNNNPQEFLEYVADPENTEDVNTLLGPKPEDLEESSESEPETEGESSVSEAQTPSESESEE